MSKRKTMPSSKPKPTGDALFESLGLGADPSATASPRDSGTRPVSGEAAEDSSRTAAYAAVAERDAADGKRTAKVMLVTDQQCEGCGSTVRFSRGLMVERQTTTCRTLKPLAGAVEEHLCRHLPAKIEVARQSVSQCPQCFEEGEELTPGEAIPETPATRGAGSCRASGGRIDDILNNL